MNLVPYLPTTTHGLAELNFALAAPFTVVSMTLNWVYCRFFEQHKALTPSFIDCLFNGGTFAAGATILLGMADDNLLKLIGDTTYYLLFSASIMVWTAISSLKIRKMPRSVE